MRKAEYRDSFGFLDEYRGKIFEGMWPSVPGMFHISVMRFPDNLCFHAFEPEIKLTYREAEAKIEAAARALDAMGFRQGDKIAVSGHNSIEWAVAYFAVIWIGGIIVPLDPTFKDHEMEHFITFGGVKGIFLPHERIGNIDRDGALGLVKLRLEDVLSMDGPEIEFPRSQGSDLAAILFTSGTTGTPKGVMLTHDNLVSDIYLTEANLDFRSTDTIYAILPLHHAYTMEAVVFLATSIGGAVVFGRKLAMSRIFREETGVSFHQYLNNVRITKAKELIRTTNLRLTDISQMVGYDDQSYFTKVFKRTAGIAPGEYVKKYRSSSSQTAIQPFTGNS